MLYHVEAQLLRASSRGIRHSSSSAPRMVAAATATAQQPSAPAAVTQPPSRRPTATSLGGIIIENIPTGVPPPPWTFNQNRDNRTRSTQRRDTQAGGNQPRDNQPRDKRPRENRPRDNQARDNRPRDTQARDNRPRDNQTRDNRPRDAQVRDNRPRGIQPREFRPRDNQSSDARASAPNDGSAPRRWNNQNQRSRAPRMNLGWKDDLVPNSFTSRLISHSQTLRPTSATEQASVTDQSSAAGQAPAAGRAAVEDVSSPAPAEPRVRLIRKGRRERGDRQHDSRNQESHQAENRTTQTPVAAEKRGKSKNRAPSGNNAVINSKMQTLEDTDLSTLFGGPVPMGHVSPRIRSTLARTAGDYSQFLSGRVALGTTGKLGINPVSYARHVLGQRRDVGLGQKRQALRVIGGFVKAKPTSSATASA